MIHAVRITGVLEVWESLGRRPTSVIRYSALTLLLLNFLDNPGHVWRDPRSNAHVAHSRNIEIF